MIDFFKKQPTARIIVLGFLFVILLGSFLLWLPISHKAGVSVSYLDALYTSTSAVCVTGLVVVDTGTTFSVFGQIVLALLIQIGGLGVTAVGAGLILALGRKMNLKSRNLIQDAMNLNSGKGIVLFIKDIFITTFVFELFGALVSLIVFAQKYPFGQALGISFFHSIAAFNNSGFDVFGNNFGNMIGYENNVLLNLITCFLVFFGGIGFLVIREMWAKKFKWKKFSMHTKAVLATSTFLIVSGTLLLKLTEGKNISWLGAFFHSVSARTAGFATYSLGSFSTAALIVIIILMFIGASPGSTGGGIKTTTFFVLFQGIKSSATNKSEKAFKYSIPIETFRKASVITLLALSTVLVSTLCIVSFNPEVPLRDALFEMTSAFGTVGLSTGITPTLSIGSKIVSIIVMFIGRLGPLTIASLWYFTKGEHVKYPEGNISVG